MRSREYALEQVLVHTNDIGSTLQMFQNQDFPLVLFRSYRFQSFDHHFFFVFIIALAVFAEVTDFAIGDADVSFEGSDTDCSVADTVFAFAKDGRRYEIFC